METTLEKPFVESSFNISTFDHSQRIAKMLSSSSLIPKDFQNNIQNTLIALEIANRIGASPLMVMQNLYIVHGKPSWSSTFIIAALNSCKRFSPLRFEMIGEGDSMECYAWAYELETKDKIIGPVVTMKMAKSEGWVDKNGSKWKTMPSLMIRYRAAAFFGRLYAPEIMMGMQSSDELHDIQHEVVSRQEIQKQKESDRIVVLIDDAKSLDDLKAVEPHLQEEHLDLFTLKKDSLTIKK